MRSRWVCATLLATLGLAMAGCGRPPATASRPPTVAPDPHQERAADVPSPALPPIRDVVARPPELRPVPLELRAPVLHVVVSATLPSAPPVLAPTRPATGGPDLALADLALQRGDPLDAAAQYRALLERSPPGVTPYVRYQLARALEQLGDAEAADEQLQGAARDTGPVGWAAATRIAERRAARVGAVAAAAALRPNVANGRSLEAFLVRVRPEDEAAALLLAIAVRETDCGYAVAAVERHPAAMRDPYALYCLSAAFVYGTPAYRRIARIRDFIVAFNRAGARWAVAAIATAEGDRAPEPWVAIAEEYLDLRFPMGSSTYDDLITDGAAAALRIAVELIHRDPSLHAALSTKIGELAFQLRRPDREVILDALANLARGGAP